MNFVSIFIFLVDLCLKLMYVMNSKFANLQIRILYIFFLKWRAGFIAIYIFCFIVLRSHKVYYTKVFKSKKKNYVEVGRLTTEEKEIDEADDPDAALDIL